MSKKESIDNCDVPTFRPLTMQYLGSKSRIVTDILDSIKVTFSSQRRFVDLFSGSGVVAYEALRRGYHVVANDIQPYSATLLKSLLGNQSPSLLSMIEELKEHCEKYLFTGSRKNYLAEYMEERKLFSQFLLNNIDWHEYKSFTESSILCSGSELNIENLKKNEQWTLFLAYYRNTYFGVKQCAEIDCIREFAEKLPSDIKIHLLASVVSVLTHSVSSTTHLAQFLKPNNFSTTKNLVKKRSISIMDETIKRLYLLESAFKNEESIVLQMDFRAALKNIELDSNTVVYADPPYFKEHYSRYYHILDTFVLYDYPTLTFNKRIGKTTIGRYRHDRIVSDFGKKTQAQAAFKDLIDMCVTANAKLVISYASTSLISHDFFEEYATERKLKITTKKFLLKHTGQGQSRHKNVTEYLFMISR